MGASLCCHLLLGSFLFLASLPGFEIRSTSDPSGVRTPAKDWIQLGLFSYFWGIRRPRVFQVKETQFSLSFLWGRKAPSLFMKCRKISSQTKVYIRIIISLGSVKICRVVEEFEGSGRSLGFFPPIETNFQLLHSWLYWISGMDLLNLPDEDLTEGKWRVLAEIKSGFRERRCESPKLGSYSEFIVRRFLDMIRSQLRVTREAQSMDTFSSH